MRKLMESLLDLEEHEVMGMVRDVGRIQGL